MNAPAVIDLAHTLSLVALSAALLVAAWAVRDIRRRLRELEERADRRNRHATWMFYKLARHVGIEIPAPPYPDPLDKGPPS